MDQNTLGPELGPHYYGIKDPSIIEKVVQFIDKYHEQDQIIPRVTLAFVKNFTKVASNIIDYYEKQDQSHPFSLNQLTWIYDFNIRPRILHGLKDPQLNWPRKIERFFSVNNLFLE